MTAQPWMAVPRETAIIMPSDFNRMPCSHWQIQHLRHWMDKNNSCSEFQKWHQTEARLYWSNSQLVITTAISSFTTSIFTHRPILSNAQILTSRCSDVLDFITPWQRRLTFDLATFPVNYSFLFDQTFLLALHLKGCTLNCWLGSAQIKVK